MFSAKLQTVVTLPLVFETEQIIYRFGIELNFPCNAYCGVV